MLFHGERTPTQWVERIKDGEVEFMEDVPPYFKKGDKIIADVTWRHCSQEGPEMTIHLNELPIPLGPE